MNVIMISPGYPAEMAFFARGLAAAGASVIGIGDQPPSAVPRVAREALTHYLQVGSLAAGDAVAATVDDLARHMRIDRVECLWEPYMLLAARLREELGLPGMTVTQTFPFRDKELMKQVLGAAGVRTPGHEAADTVAGVWAAAERLEYPLIVKPIAGAGAADTYRADSAADLDALLPDGPPRGRERRQDRVDIGGGVRPVGVGRGRCSPSCTSGSARSPWRCATWMRPASRRAGRSAP